MNCKQRYRYLNKYIGTYRVMALYDLDTNDFPRNEQGAIDESFEDMYIPCKRGKIIHTYYDDYELCILFENKLNTAKNVFKEIKSKYPKLDIKFEDWGIDGCILFKDEDIKKVATIIKPKTSGASINPFSNKNLPKIDYKIPEEDLVKLYALVENMDKIKKMQFFKKCNADFITSIGHKEKLKNSRLPAKEYIHSIGKWNKYIKFVKLARD